MEILKTKVVEGRYSYDHILQIRNEIFALGREISIDISNDVPMEKTVSRVLNSDDYKLIDKFVYNLASVFYTYINLPKVIEDVYKVIGKPIKVGNEEMYYLFNGIRCKILNHDTDSFTYSLIIDTVGDSYLIPTTRSKKIEGE